MKPVSRTAELVPVTERYLWVLVSRSLVTAALTALLLVDRSAAAGRYSLLAEAAGWLMLSYAGLPLVRRFRRFALLAFRVGLLGDGVLLAWAWWTLGGPGSPVQLLIYVQVLGATLLGSFRTGLKIAFWHSLLAAFVVEIADTRGQFSDAEVYDAVSYLCYLWMITVFTATFAAVNERELRRRRYDSETLRVFGIALTGSQSPLDVLRRLSAFARDDLLVDRIAVVAYPQSEESEPVAGFGLVTGPDGEQPLTDLSPQAMDHRVRTAEPDTPVRLLRRLDPVADPALAGWLRNARNVIVLPYAMDQVRGVVAVTRDRGGPLTSRRVERRVVVSLHQATLQAGVAVGRELLHAQVRWAAERDPLTGLANRGRFNARLTAAVNEARANGPGFALIMVDLDHFKTLNDTYGHQTGDEALQVVAQVLQSWCRAEDLAARYGGEEFTLILRGLTRDDAVAVAERIRFAIETVAFRVPMTASLGLTMVSADGGDERSALAAADAALYRAKEGGRNRVTISSVESPRR